MHAAAAAKKTSSQRNLLDANVPCYLIVDFKHFHRVWSCAPRLQLQPRHRMMFGMCNVRCTFIFAQQIIVEIFS